MGLQLPQPHLPCNSKQIKPASVGYYDSVSPSSLIFHVEDDEGTVFDYDIKPADSTIELSTAKTTVFAMKYSILLFTGSSLDYAEQERVYAKIWLVLLLFTVA